MKFEFNKKKCLRIAGITLGSIAALVILFLIFFSVIAKGMIQNVGPMITGVPMKVNAVLFNAFTGTFSIKGLVVGNPEGYSSPHAFALKEFHVDVAMTSLFSKKLLIEEIRIKGVELNYETSLLNNNLAEIQKNVEKLAGGKAQTEKKEEKPAEKSEAKPLQINHIELKDITAWVIVKGTKVQTPIPVLPITLNDLGTSPEGVTSAMVINDVMLSLLTSLLKTTGINQAASAISKGTEKTLKSLGTATSDSFDFLKKQVNKAADAVKK